MRKLLDYLLLAIAIAALIAAFEWYRAFDRTKKAEAYVQAHQNARKETRDEPSPLIAMQSQRIELAEEYMAGMKSNGLRFERAGALFLGIYLPAADILPQICLQNRVDLDAFRRAYEVLHREPLDRAQALTTGTPVKEAALRKQYEEQWRVEITKFLAQLAAARDRTIADECRAIAEGGAGLAAMSNLAPRLPKTYSVLLEKR